MLNVRMFTWLQSPNLVLTYKVNYDYPDILFSELTIPLLAEELYNTCYSWDWGPSCRRTLPDLTPHLSSYHHLFTLSFIKNGKVVFHFINFFLLKKHGLKWLSQPQDDQVPTFDGGGVISGVGASNSVYTLFHVKQLAQ